MSGDQVQQHQSNVPQGYPPSKEKDIRWNKFSPCTNCHNNVKWNNAYGSLTQPNIQFLCVSCWDLVRIKKVCNSCKQDETYSGFKPMRILTGIEMNELVVCNNCVQSVQRAKNVV